MIDSIVRRVTIEMEEQRDEAILLLFLAGAKTLKTRKPLADDVPYIQVQFRKVTFRKHLSMMRAPCSTVTTTMIAKGYLKRYRSIIWSN